MLDFVLELDRLVQKWPEGAAWNVSQIATYTETPVTKVIEFLSGILERDLESQDPLSFEEITKVHTVLRERMQYQLIAREKAIRARQIKAAALYDIVMEKVRVLQAGKNYRSAYKTLSYFVGQHEKDIDRDLRLTLFGECLRLGIKAAINLQELAVWFRKGIEVALSEPSVETLEEAFDFISAYSEYFLKGTEAKGTRLLASVLSSVQQVAHDFELVSQFSNLFKESALPDHLVPEIRIPEQTL